MAERRGDPSLLETGPPEASPGLNVLAQIQVSLGQISSQLQEQTDQARKLWQAVRPLPGIAVPQITTASGTADYPELLSPRMGYWWDVKSVTAATFSAGTVNLYAGAQTDSTLRYVFTSAGTFAFGTGQLLVPPGQRLIFVAVSVTGKVTPSLSVIEIADYALPAYLM